MNFNPIQILILLFIAAALLFFVPSTLDAQHSVLIEATERDRVDITITSSRNILISNSTSFVGAFGTMYNITGTSDDIKNSRDLVIASILDDFTNTSTIGYVKLSDSISNASHQQEIPNPFASNNQIEEKIQELIEKSVADSTNSKKDVVSIICNFGNSLDLFSCAITSALQ